MSLRRLLVVSLTTFGLIALPGVASSASAEADSPSPVKAAATTAAKAASYPTRIGFFSFDRARVYRTETVIVGQILTDNGGTTKEGSLRGVATLERRYQGSTKWMKIGEAETTNPDRPRFTFRVQTVANAFYRVRFAGDDKGYLPSFKDVKVSAIRKITTHVKSLQLLVYGNVAPSYTGKSMVVERKSCVSCDFKRVRTIKVRAHSKYRTTLSAPANGRWWWRLTTRGDSTFVASHTATIVTRRIG